MKRTLKFGRARSASRSPSRSPSPARVPSGYNKFRQAYIKKLTANNSNSNSNLNYAGVEYNKPYFILPNNTIISRFSMYGAVNKNYGQPKPNTIKNIVAWVKAQQNNNSKKNRIFIVQPLTRKVYTARNVKIVQ